MTMKLNLHLFEHCNLHERWIYCRTVVLECIFSQVPNKLDPECMFLNLGTSKKREFTNDLQ